MLNGSIQSYKGGTGLEDDGPGAAAPRAAPLAALRWCPLWPALLLATLIVPTEFSFALGSLRLTPYRVVLMVAFGPCLMRLLSGRAGPAGPADLLLAAHLLWAYIVFSHHHGNGVAIESGGIRMLEAGGAYLIARTCILNERDFRGFMAALGAILCLLAPFVLLESATGLHLIKTLSAKLTGNVFYSEIETRFGFHRAFGPFDHPIHLGVFAASGLGIAWLASLPRLGHPQARRLPSMAAVAGAVSSLSAGALAALGGQCALLLWERRTRHVQLRWRLLAFLLTAVYLAVDTLSNRSGMHVFLHYLTFNAHTAYYRMVIFEWGMREVWLHPFLGIGLNAWTRPEWMHSLSMDNFWLVQAVTFGIPGFITLALAFVFILGRGWRGLSPRLTRLRLGWAISLVGMAIAACTVHFWNHLFVYFLFFLGTGAWFQNVRRSVDDPNTHERAL